MARMADERGHGKFQAKGERARTARLRAAMIKKEEQAREAQAAPAR